MCGLDERPQFVDGVVDERRDVHLPLVESVDRCLEARHLEKVVHHGDEEACAAVDLAELVDELSRNRSARSPQQRLQAQQHRVHRRAQVVRHHRVEIEPPRLHTALLGHVPQRHERVRLALPDQPPRRRAVEAISRPHVGERRVGRVSQHGLGELGKDLPERPSQEVVDGQDPPRRRIGIGGHPAVVDHQDRVRDRFQEVGKGGFRLRRPLEQAPRPQERADPRAQLVVGVRLRQIVVRTGDQALDDLLGGILRGEEQDGDLLQPGPLRARVLAHLDARDAGHHPVQHQNVGQRPGREAFDGRRSVLQPGHLVSIGQRLARALRIERAVVDDPDGG